MWIAVDYTKTSASLYCLDTVKPGLTIWTLRNQMVSIRTTYLNIKRYTFCLGCFFLYGSQYEWWLFSYMWLAFRRVNKITKRTISVVMSVCLSVHPFILPFVHMEQLRSHWTAFHKIVYLSIFRKSYRENSKCINIPQEWWAFFIKTSIHLWSHVAKFFLEHHMFRTKLVRKIKIRISYSICF